MSGSCSEADIVALKCHGYIFSDGDDSTTDAEREADFSDVEFYARYKPPPLDIPREKIIVIKCSSANQGNEKNYLLENNYAFKKNKKKLSQQKSQKIIEKSALSINNYYKVLQQNDSLSEPEIEYTEETDASGLSTMERKVNNQELLAEYLKANKRSHRESKKRKKESKKRSGDPRISAELDTLEKNESNSYKYDLKSKVVTKSRTSQLKRKIQTTRQHKDEQLFKNYIDVFPLFPLYCLQSNTKTVVSEAYTTWDYIFSNCVYRSDKLIEQEYDNIISSQEIPASLMLPPELFPTVTPPPVGSTTSILKEIYYMEYLNMIGNLVATYVFHRINR